MIAGSASPAGWLARWPRWARLLAAFAAGALMTAGQPPVSVPWGMFLAVPMLAWLIDDAGRPRAAFWLGWAAAFGYFTTGLYWIGHAFLVDAERFAWMMPFAVTLLPAFLGFFWGAALWLTARAGRAGWTRVLVLAGWLTLIEYLRAHALTGFPWALPGYVWVETPLAQAAAWAGPFGLTLITLLLSGLPLVGLVGRGVASKAAGVLAIAAIGALWWQGAGRLAAAASLSPEGPVVRLVQPNAEQALKWHPDWIGVFYNRLLEATAASPEPALGPPDVVIWPETAVPFLPAEAPERMAELAGAAGPARLIIGALHRERPSGRLRNSMMVLDGTDILQRYDKHHLVPFGEYLPYPWFFASLGFQKLVPGQGFAAGPGPRTLAVPGLPPFSPLICYEMIFPGRVAPDAPRPAWLLQVTNDAWFGRYGGPQQHLAQARFRAIEQGLPVARAANTGISAMIDPYGRITGSLPLGAHGHSDSRLPAALPPTLYARFGDWPALALALIFSLFATSWRRRPAG